MRTVAFSKWQGLQNDFIIIDGRREPWLTATDVIRLCDRRTGIGADGVLTVLPPRDPATADLRMDVQNSDGSRAEMCGNGLRCVVGWAQSPSIRVDTDAGVKAGQILASGAIRVELGSIRVTQPMLQCRFDTWTAEGARLDAGNPHFVLKPAAADADLHALAAARGSALESHAQFPNRTNVEFSKPLGPNAIALVVFERGSGITQACGTGAAATAAAYATWGHVDPSRPVDVMLPGGGLRVELERGEGGFDARIVGAALPAFEGTFSLADS